MMNTEPHEVCTVQAVHVESPIVDPKESSVQGDGSEKKSDVAPACTGGSESTNSGNVSSLVSSFFMSLPRDQMLGGTFILSCHEWYLSYFISICVTTRTSRYHITYCRCFR